MRHLFAQPILSLPFGLDFFCKRGTCPTGNTLNCVRFCKKLLAGQAGCSGFEPKTSEFSAQRSSTFELAANTYLPKGDPPRDIASQSHLDKPSATTMMQTFPESPSGRGARKIRTPGSGAAHAVPCHLAMAPVW